MRRLVIALILFAFCVAAAPSDSGSGALRLPLDEDPNFSQASPAPGTGSGAEDGDYLPPIAGASADSDISGTIAPAGETPEPTTFYLGVIDDKGKAAYFRGLTDPNGRFRFRLPRVSAGITAVELFRLFDKNGQPDQGAICLISDKPTHLAGTQTIAHVPATGPVVLEASSAYERGGTGQGIVIMQVRAVDASTAQVLMDDSVGEIDTLAASNRSVVGKIHDDAELKKHVFLTSSSSGRTNRFTSALVSTSFDALPPLKLGEVIPVTFHVKGLAPGDAAVVIFDVGGSARLVGGGSTVAVPIIDGTATVAIRAVEPGPLHIGTSLQVSLSDFSK